MRRVVVIGGGWSGCAAALAAKKAGAEVTLLEKTDLLLGLGNVGGIMRNNGRYTAAEENIALGASELFSVTDRLSRHVNIDFPGHRHASLYDVIKIEPEVRRLLRESGIDVRLTSRAVDVSILRVAADENEKRNGTSEKRGIRAIESITLADGEVIEGDVFVECTGSTGPMGNCLAYGNGCSMCILRCPAFGPRVSISEKAGGSDIMGTRVDGSFGAFSGSGKLVKESLSQEIQQMLNERGVAVIPLPKEQVKKDKLDIKVCQQYALDEFAENIVLLDTGHAKIMTPFFPLEKLREVPGFEDARYADPYAGGKGNSIRYLSVAERDDNLKVNGVLNLFCGGEKSGLFVGHTEAISTGSLAGHNAARYIAGAGLLKIPRILAIGDIIAFARERSLEKDGLMTRYTFAGSTYFDRMKTLGLYSTDPDEIAQRVESQGLSGIYNKRFL
ncbi:MAG: FAD-dependent oxidoreductase [Clostridiales bacterium]|nr:FAD-dependent oxidoreductase [Clostridiales bacterium]